MYIIKSKIEKKKRYMVFKTYTVGGKKECIHNVFAQDTRKPSQWQELLSIIWCSLPVGAGRKYATVCIVKELSVFSLLFDDAVSWELVYFHASSNAWSLDTRAEGLCAGIVFAQRD